MIQVLRILLRNCKKTTELIDKQMFISLTFKEKMQLKAHKAICQTCNSYDRQSKFIDALIGKWFGINPNKTTSKLDENKKNNIIEAIKKL